MRVMTYNILAGAKGRLDKIVDVVTLQNPDILAVQEANGFDEDCRLEAFGERTGLEYFSLAAGNHVSRKNGPYHVATFSKHPVYPIPLCGRFHHAALHTVVEIEAAPVHVVNTHLDPHFDKNRVREMNKILRELQGEHNALIMGDLNSLSPDDDYQGYIPHFTDYLRRNFVKKGAIRTGVIQRALDAGFVDTAVRLGVHSNHTMPTPLSYYQDGLFFRVDYILASVPLARRLAGGNVVYDSLTDNASDHYPYVVDFS